MNKSTGLIATAVLTAALTSCSVLGLGGSSEISRPGPEISHAPEHHQADPPCGLRPQCPR
jgi:hypothetical protein